MNDPLSCDKGESETPPPPKKKNKKKKKTNKQTNKQTNKKKQKKNKQKHTHTTNRELEFTRIFFSISVASRLFVV